MGFFIQAKKAWKEKLVVRNNAVRKVVAATSPAPQGLKAARRDCARIVPNMPPAGSALRTSGMGSIASADEKEASSIVKPTIFAIGASSSWLRNHFIATKNIPTGNKNAAKPQNWKKRSARCAPTGPIQLRAGPAPYGGAETLNDASCGE